MTKTEDRTEPEDLTVSPLRSERTSRATGRARVRPAVT